MAMMASRCRPQPRQFLSYHMTPMSLQMSLPAIQPRPILGQPSQLPPPQRTIQALQPLPSRLLVPKAKALQLTQHLQQGSKMVMTMPKRLPHPSFDVPNAQRRNLLWVSSSKSPFAFLSAISSPRPNSDLLANNLTSSRHLKTHTLPYRCDFQGCGIGKATQRDLDRHKDTHGKIRLYFCPVRGCPWHVNGPKVGFSRRLDNAKRHLKSHANNQDLSVLREDSQGGLSRV
jgi:hypothetical protein